MGNILLLRPIVLAVPGVVLVLLAHFVPIALLSSSPFLVATAQTPCRPQCLGGEVLAIQDVDRFGDPRIGRLEVK